MSIENGLERNGGLNRCPMKNALIKLDDKLNTVLRAENEIVGKVPNFI